MTIAAVILIGLGLALRAWSGYTLQGSFTIYLRLPGSITTSGPYRFIRHPAYVGSVLILAGVALLDTGIAVCLLAATFYQARVAQEECILSQHPDYVKYMARTPRWLPRLRRGKKGAATW